MDRESIFDGGGIVLQNRATPFDALLATLGVGISLAMVALYCVYLMVRMSRGRRKDRSRSKADRPVWVWALCVSGSVWIISMLFYNGVLILSPELQSACTLIEQVGIYTLGWALWTVLCLYKLVRKYFQLRCIDTKPPHALLAILLLLIPFIVVNVLAFFFDLCERNDSDLCVTEIVWSYPLAGVALLYLFLFLFLLIKIRRTLGDHHEIIRYSIFLSTSFTFPLLDLILKLVGWAEYTLTGQLMIIFVLLLVTLNITHIFILVLRRKRSKHVAGNGILPPNHETLRSPAIMTLSSLSSLEERASSPSAALQDLNAMLSEDPLAPRLSTPSASAPWMRRATRERPADILPDFERFVANLPEQLANRVDRNRGFFVPRNRTTDVNQYDLDASEKYLK